MFESGPISPELEFGSIVTNLSMSDLDDAVIVKALTDLWVERGLIVFKGLAGGDEELIRLSRSFGELEAHPLKHTQEKGCPELVAARYMPGNGHVYEVSGERRGGWLPWHSDLIYVEKINRGGILSPVQLPANGGQTGFIDQISAYYRLPESLRQQIEGLEVIYKLDLDMTHQKFGRTPGLKLVQQSVMFANIMENAEKYPRVLHPLVYQQRETGRKVLNVSPWFAVGIAGMENGEGDRLLAEVIELGVDPGYAYFHQWEEGDMVLWDNWRMLHCAQGVPEHDSRVMKRTTIKGDYALGRAEHVDEGASDVAHVVV